LIGILSFPLEPVKKRPYSWLGCVVDELGDKKHSIKRRNKVEKIGNGRFR
jgi:hypothetical protein